MGVLVAFIASSPYIYGALLKKEGLVFLGRSVVNSADTYVYLSNIISAKEGNLILPNLYTTESKIPFEIRPIYFLLGFFARIFYLNPLLTYHLSRFILTIIFVLMLFKFIGIFFEDKKKSGLALMITLFSSGIGAFVQKWFPASIDLWVPEGNTFFSLLEAPHFISTQIFLMLSIYLFMKYKENNKKKYFYTSSFFAAGSILEYPYLVPLIFSFSAILILFFSHSKSLLIKLCNILQYFFLPIISFLIIYRVFSLSQSAQFWHSQNILPTPSIENLLYGYGILIPFALIGFLISDLNRKGNLSLLLWIVLTLILIYIPFSFQRRLLEGLHIPIAILASFGFFYLFKKIQSKFFKSIFALGLIIILPATNIYNLFKIINSYQKDTQNNYIHYLDKDEMAGMEWVAANSKVNEVILANQFYSNIIPGVTGRFVYHGHRFLTYKPELKLQLFNGFMQEEDEKVRREFLRKYSINYIYFGKNDPYNRFLGSIAKQKFLEKVWERNGVTIFKVPKTDTK